MFDKLGIQLYTVRNYMTDEAGVKYTFDRLAEIGYKEIQTVGEFPCSVEKFAEHAKNAGLTCVGTHYGFPADINDIEDYVALHKTLGTNIAGVGGGSYGKTKEEVLAYIEKVNTLAENLSKYGMKFSYHHHSHEFAKVPGGARVIDYMVDGFDKNNVSFVLDTYWLNHAGVEVNAWIEKLAGRADILHLKDCELTIGSNDGHITMCGDGNIDFERVIKTAEASGVKHLCVEQDIWPAGFDSLNYCAKKSFDYLSQFLK